MIIDVMCEHDLIDYLNLVFDQDEEVLEASANSLLRSAKVRPPAESHAAIISFADAKVCYCLQAADCGLSHTGASASQERPAGRKHCNGSV